ncbi:MAG TPA: bifunctional DNA primase/polymerase [Mycobacteriales bacterium]
MARTLRVLVDEWGLAVVPGAFAENGLCSCGDRHCPDPGRHALADASWLAATSDPERVRDRWRSHPEAAVVLPVGWCFDLLEVPERGGREALGRLEVMGHRLPPVIATAAGRLLFLVSALDRRPAEAAEAGAPAPRAAEPVPGAGGSAASREAAARDAAAARAAVSEPEPWPTSSSWLASAAGCLPETSIWVGGGAPDAPDVIVRRSGLLVAPLLGAEPPGVTRWLIPPAPVREPLPRMEDVLGPIVRACRDATECPVPAARAAGPVRGPVGAVPAGSGSLGGPAGAQPVSRSAGTPGSGATRDAGARQIEAAPGPEGPPREPACPPEKTGRRRPEGVIRRSDVVSDRGAETVPAARPVALPRRAWVASMRPDGPPRRPEAPAAREPDAAEALSARLPDDVDRRETDRLSSQARGQLRTRPLERYSRPVLGLMSGRGAGPGPGRVQPPASAGARKGPLRVD